MDHLERLQLGIGIMSGECPQYHVPLRFLYKPARTKDSLPADDQSPITDTGKMRVAMLSEQLKKLGELPYISWRWHFSAETNHYDRPSSLRSVTFPIFLL